MTHPARFSPEVIDVVHELLVSLFPEPPRPMLWDPFAGEGRRLGVLALSVDMEYGGTEIEASLIGDAGIKVGDATDPLSYPEWPFLIFTSPVYPNGMADSWRMSDRSKRYTYRFAVGEAEGEDRELHEHNMGRYGYRGTTRGMKSPKRAAYWRIAREAVLNWRDAELVILNVSDFRAKGGVEPLVSDWRDLLVECGWIRQTVIPVTTRRMRNGANADERVDVEQVVVAERHSG